MSQSAVAPTLQLPFCTDATDGKKDAGPEKLQRAPAAVGLWCERTILKSIKKRPVLCISHVQLDRQSHLTAKGRNVPSVDQVKHLCVNLIQGVYGNIT
jgi:hypothetical protein